MQAINGVAGEEERGDPLKRESFMEFLENLSTKKNRWEKCKSR